MIYRRLGRTNLKVSVIGVGGGAFRGSDKFVDQAKEVIKTAVERGVNFIETAEDYDETKIAPAIKNLKENVILASKSFSSNKKNIETSLKNSLKKLKTDYIDIYMLHTITTKESLEFIIKNDVLNFLKKMKSEGKIGFIGISGHSVPALIKAIETNEFDVVEVPYCIGGFDSEKVFEIAKEYDVGVIAIRCFGGGILINPNKQPKEVNFMNVKNSLGYVLSNKNVSTSLIGMSQPEHVKENIEVINENLINLSKSRREKIEDRVKNFLGQDFCRGCLACMPCDAYGWKFPIDQLMRMEVFYSKYGMKGVIKDFKNLDININDCSKCEKCEKKCSYNVPIVKNIFKLNKISVSF